MKYLKYTLVIVGLLSILGVGNAYAKMLSYSNIKLPALHGTWISNEEQKQNEYTVQFFSNDGARDALGSEFAVQGRTYAVYTSPGFSDWVTAEKNTCAWWRGQNDAPNYYKLYLKADRYNGLAVSYSGVWGIDVE